MKKMMLTFGLMLTTMIGFSQYDKFEVESIGDQWQSYFENNAVKVEVMKKDCSFPQDGIHQQFLLFKYENKSSTAVNIELHNDIYYNDQCSTCNSTEYDYYFELGAGEVLESQCDLSLKPYRAVFVKQLNMNTRSKLTAIQLNKFKVVEVQ